MSNHPALARAEYGCPSCKALPGAACVSLGDGVNPAGAPMKSLHHSRSEVERHARKARIAAERALIPKLHRGTLSMSKVRRIWDRDGWECVTCGGHRDLTIDHRIPVSKGGKNDDSNLQTMCRTCNSRKGAR